MSKVSTFKHWGLRQDVCNRLVPNHAGPGSSPIYVSDLGRNPSEDSETGEKKKADRVSGGATV